MKGIFIIEAKLDLEKIQRLYEILESNELGFTRIDSCTRADYIVTELISPTRIVRNARRVLLKVLIVYYLSND
jgi:hypothetical protein